MTPYQKYQLQWMIDHGKSLDDLMYSMTEFQRDGTTTEGESPITEVFYAWEFVSNGFGGEIWACEAEWEECEAQAEGRLAE